MGHRPEHPTLLAAILLLILVGCASSPPTRYYTLGTGYRPAPAHQTSGQGVHVGLWRVQLPEMLQRSEIVTRDDRYRVSLADLHRWAERLDDNISRRLAEELAQRLDSENISLSPWRAYITNDYQVKIEFTRFDGTLGGDVVVSGTWLLLSGRGDSELSRKPFRYAAQADGGGYSELVATLDELTRLLARDIAEWIRAYQGALSGFGQERPLLVCELCINQSGDNKETNIAKSAGELRLMEKNRPKQAAQHKIWRLFIMEQRSVAGAMFSASIDQRFP